MSIPGDHFICNNSKCNMYNRPQHLGTLRMTDDEDMERCDDGYCWNCGKFDVTVSGDE